MPQCQSAGDDKADENADQKENTIRRKRDEKNGDDGKSDQQRSRPLQPETKSAFGFGGHRKYSSAIRAIESLAAFSGGLEMGRIGMPSLFSFAIVSRLGCPETAAEA